MLLFLFCWSAQKDDDEQHSRLPMRSYGLTWEGSKGKPALGDYYLSLGDKLSAVCPSCILLLEGTGQSKFLGVDWCAHAFPISCAITGQV